MAKGTMKGSQKWNVVERPQAPVWKPGDKPGSSITGELWGRKEVEVDGKPTVIYEIKNDEGLHAIFARNELLDKLDLVWAFPGKGTVVRITFSSWEPTKHGKGKERRAWTVEFRNAED